MKFEQKNSRSAKEKIRDSESFRLWLASIAVGAVGIGGAAVAHETVTSDSSEVPVLVLHEDDSGARFATDQHGEKWVPITIERGGTIDEKLGGNRDAIARTIEANGITNASDVRPEQPLWAPAEATDRD